MSATLEKLLRDARIDLVLSRIEKDSSVLNEVIEYLDSEIRSIKFNAIFILGELGQKSVNGIPKLINCLDSEDWSIIREAVRSLGKIGPLANESIPKLTGLLTSKEDTIRKETAIALGNIQKLSIDAIKGLTSALKDNNEEVRAETAKALGKMGPEGYEIVPELIKSLKDISWLVRTTSAQSISQIGKVSPKAIPTLISALEDKDWRVRYRVINTLAQIGGDEIVSNLLKYLNHNKSQVRKEAVDALGELKQSDPVVLESLYPLLEDGNEAVRGKTADTLRSIGKKAIPPLIKSYDDNLKFPIDWVLYWVLIFLAVPYWLLFGGIYILILPLLISFILTLRRLILHIMANQRKKIMIISSLGGMGPDAIEAVPFIIDLLKTKVNAKIRAEMARTLGKIGINSEQAVLALEGTLNDPKSIVRREAALALGKIGSLATRAVPTLVKSLQDKNADVRWRASEALGFIGVNTNEVISNLNSLIHDECDYVCESAINAIDSLTEE
ncbi:MAG: HEAT repeat domain-containing protein [Promethearchaeota archaeon]